MGRVQMVMSRVSGAPRTGTIATFAVGEQWRVRSEFPARVLGLLGVCLFVGAALVGCAGPAVQRQPAEVFDVALALPFDPSWLAVVPRPGGSYLYLEGGAADAPGDGSGGEGGSELRAAYVMPLDTSGAPSGPLTTLVPRFAATLGAPVTDPEGALIVPLTRTPGGVEVVLELWRWNGAGAAERVVSCYLPRPRFGRLVYLEADPIYVFEAADGRLAAIPLGDEGAACGSPPAAVDLWLPPLPERYLVETLEGRIAISGQAGDSYTLRLYGPDLAPVRRMRMAVGAATEAHDFELFELPDRPPLAVFAALVEGVHDLYLAEVPAYGTSSVHAERIVATADSESEPHILPLGEALIVSWTVEDGSGDRLRLAAPRREDGVRVRGGEILWRTPHDALGRRAWTWVDTGFLRVWTEPAATGATLRLQVYEPTFWGAASGARGGVTRGAAPQAARGAEFSEAQRLGRRKRREAQSSLRRRVFRAKGALPAPKAQSSLRRRDWGAASGARRRVL
jgi:hypothetical protein